MGVERERALDSSEREGWKEDEAVMVCFYYWHSISNHPQTLSDFAFILSLPESSSIQCNPQTHGQQSPL